VKRRELLDHLIACGCEAMREGGRHTVIVNLANRKKSAVPRHGEINNNTAKSICRQLNVPPPTKK